jgi:hypothetical protein
VKKRQRRITRLFKYSCWNSVARNIEKACSLTGPDRCFGNAGSLGIIAMPEAGNIDNG